MKKYFLFMFCALLLFVVTGCGKHQVVCTATGTEDGITFKTEVVADLDGSDKITGLKMTYDLGDETTASQYCSLFKMFLTSDDSNAKVECSGSKIIMSGIESIDVDSEDAEKIVGKTKDEFVSELEKNEELEFTCK